MVVDSRPRGFRGRRQQWLNTLRGKFVLDLRARDHVPRTAGARALRARGDGYEINAQRAETQRAFEAALPVACSASAQPQEAGRTVTRGSIPRASSALARSRGLVAGASTRSSARTRGGCPASTCRARTTVCFIVSRANNQGPRVRLTASRRRRRRRCRCSTSSPSSRGRELPNEYVLLSAHLDSWHGATGATDNGTGTLTMLEAMRILKETYPRPRRTILAGHWGGEEQGTIGSLSFAEDHPEVISGLQVAFNQDNGTWRVEIIEGAGIPQGRAPTSRSGSRSCRPR